MNHPKMQAIVPAAGSGERLQAAVRKALVPIYDKPLLVYSLEVLEACPYLESIILVADPRGFADIDDVIARYNLTKIARLVAGGATRAESVRNGLKALDEDTVYVLIHDAARPLLDQQIIDRTVAAAVECGAAIAAVPVKATVKVVDADTGRITATPDRATLWEAQTPQVFERRLLQEAQDAAPEMPVTDESRLVELIGKTVRVVQGSYRNLKVTTPEDLVCAAAMMGLPGEAGAAQGQVG